MTQRRDLDSVLAMLNDVCAGVYGQFAFVELEPTMSQERFRFTLKTTFAKHWLSVPPEPTPMPARLSVATQCSVPETAFSAPLICSPPAHVLVPNPAAPFPVRCAAATVSTGIRCRLQAYYPYTLCATHRRFFLAHSELPPGGAPKPFTPHPDDWWHVTKFASDSRSLPRLAPLGRSGV